METNLEEIAGRAENWIKTNRKALFIGGSLALTLWVLTIIKEIALLLLVSYLIAVLIDPAIRKLKRWKVGRGLATVFILLSGALLLILVLFVVLPPVIAQYADLISYLPHYIGSFTSRIGELSERFGIDGIEDPTALSTWIKEKITHFEPRNISHALSALLTFLLQGYSLTLTILNLTLLPFFVFYISADLDKIHNFIGDFFLDDTRRKFSAVLENILNQVYAFFRGQITISIVMALLYGTGLSIVGVPNGLAIGFLAGLLNIVPYLGLVIGIVLSLLAMLMAAPSWFQIFSVLGVFVVVQLIEAIILTPRIMGDKTGIHPLGIILSLVIGGELMGIFGLIVAIPAAATIKILFKFIWEEVKESRSRLVIPSATNPPSQDITRNNS